jgi:hypothetical protein
MRHPLCSMCFSAGYCRRRTSLIVSDQELANRAFVFDVRTFAFGLCIRADRWREYLCDGYRDYAGRVMNREGREELVDMEIFERPSIEEWFAHNFNGLPASENVIRLRAETRERLRAAASVLRALFPHEAQFWGLRGQAANDNRKK